MTTGGNNAEAAIVVRAVNEASEELNQIRQDTDDTSSSLFGFSRNAITAGIAALGLSFGLKEALEAGDAAIEIDAATEAILRLLGPDVEAAFALLEGSFGDIADEVVALESTVKDVALTITRESGGIVPSIEDIIFAFDLAAAAGVSVEEAAAAIGQALQGNERPLQELLDKSGRLYISAEEAQEALAGTARDAASGFDRVRVVFGRIFEELGKALDGPLTEFAKMLETFAFVLVPAVFGALGRFFGSIGQYAAEVANAGRDLATGLWNAFWDHFVEPIIHFFTEFLPNLIRDAIPDLSGIGEGIGGAFDGIGNFFGGAAGKVGEIFGISNNNAGKAPNVQVTINGNVDSAERAAEFAREVHRQMRETNRRGVNVSATGVV